MGGPVAVVPFCRVIVDSYGHECVGRGVTRVGRVSGGARPELSRSQNNFPDHKRYISEIFMHSSNYLIGPVYFLNVGLSIYSHL